MWLWKHWLLNFLCDVWNKAKKTELKWTAIDTSHITQKSLIWMTFEICPPIKRTSGPSEWASQVSGQIYHARWDKRSDCRTCLKDCYWLRDWWTAVCTRRTKYILCCNQSSAPLCPYRSISGTSLCPAKSISVHLQLQQSLPMSLFARRIVLSPSWWWGVKLMK